MKLLFSLLLSILAAALLSPNASAWSENENLLENYQSLPWEGSDLEYDPEHKTLYFSKEAEETKDALGGSCFDTIDLPADGARGIWFYVDFGNYENRGTSCVSVHFIGENGEIFESHTTEKDIGDGYFRRYQLGTESEYAAIPENTEAVRVEIRLENGETPYFRNFSLMLSSEKTAVPPKWTVSGKLQLVQVNVTRVQYWGWVAMILLVPIMLFAVRRTTDKTGKTRNYYKNKLYK